MKTEPTYQPPGPPFDGKPRVIVVKEELEQLERENNSLRSQLTEQRNKVLEEACKLIQKRADDYDAENGWTDHETGTREYPKGGDDYMLELTEIIELIATLRTTQPAKERTENESH